MMRVTDGLQLMGRRSAIRNAKVVRSGTSSTCSTRVTVRSSSFAARRGRFCCLLDQQDLCGNQIESTRVRGVVRWSSPKFGSGTSSSQLALAV